MINSVSLKNTCRKYCTETNAKEAMSEGVIRDFLTVPGITGIAVFGERSDPFFYSLDPAFGAVQQETLSQGVLQVVETIPESFEAFEFRFSDFIVQLHRLGNPQQGNGVLLVVAHHSLLQENWVSQVTNLKRLFAQDWQDTLSLLQATISSEDCSAVPTMLQPTRIASPASPQPPTALLPKTLKEASHSPIPPPTLSSYLSALSAVCTFATQYLGVPVIVNYLKSTRPTATWLQDIQIDRAANLTFTGEPSKLEAPLTPEEHQILREWSHAFLRRCSHVVRNFAILVEQEALNTNQKIVLLGE